MLSEAGRDLQRLIKEKLEFEILAKRRGEQAAKKIAEIDIHDVVNFHQGVQVRRVWGDDSLNIALLVNKNRFGGCGTLLWGVQFENKSIPELALKIDQFEAKFMVFDGRPGSHDFAMLSGAGPDEAKKLFENLRRICSSEGINYVFIKNAGVLSDTTKICPGREFKEISEFYMMIARRDGSLIPEFDFINPQNSTAFWNNW